MRIVYNPHSQKVWEDFFKAQTGRGITGFRGVQYQRGAGLGSLFGSLIRTILPVAKKVGKAVGKEALRTGAAVAMDALEGRDVGESFEEHGKAGAAQLLNKGMKKINTSKKPAKIASKKPTKPATTRKRQRGRGLGSRVKTPSKTIRLLSKKKQARASRTKKLHTDQLGGYFTEI